ncbi:uncharacterized protein LOC116176218 [Photinus pyralis]|uniref:uncharacterized protein LOC116176218 n=1 Tax=Photinus pyralis TaxID=7054 RepID=UPI001267626D|nr:uncharacterized protein LOC116176218 [Photinus pyralis]
MDFVVGTVNSCGLRRKRPLIKNLLHSDQIQILSITETKLTSNAVLSFRDYKTFQKNSSLRGARGTALLIRDRFPSTPLTLPPHLQHLECVAATVHFPNINISFFSFYNPPNDPLPDDLFRYISTLRHTVLLGDLNSRNTLFGDSTCNPNGIILANHLITLPICRVNNTTPTFVSHNGTSIVDHIIFTEPLFRYIDANCFLGTTITSDHLPLLVRTNFSPPPALPPTVIYKKDFSRANWKVFAQHITENIQPHPSLETPQDVDSAVDTLTTTISDAVSIAVPTKPHHLYRQKLPDRILNLIREKRRVFRQYLRSRDAALKTQYNRLNSLIRRETTRLTEENWVRVTSALDYRDGRRYWHQFNVLTGNRKIQRTHLTDQGGNIVSTDKDKADLFARHLQEAFQSPDLPNYDLEFKLAVEQRHPDYSKNPRQQHEDVHLYLNNTPLQLTNRIKYLGVHLTSTLNWNHDLTLTLDKVRKRIQLLSALRGRINGFNDTKSPPANAISYGKYTDSIHATLPTLPSNTQTYNLSHTDSHPYKQDLHSAGSTATPSPPKIS